MGDSEIRITILVDNHARPGLKEEHGFSLWIECRGHNILFDTGQGGALAGNAEKLGISLSKTDFMILSHGHYDHTGGVAQMLKTAPNVEVCFHPGIFQHRYSIRDGKPVPIHMSHESWTAICSLPAQRVRWINRPITLKHWAGMVVSIPRETAYEDTGGQFYLDLERRTPDLFNDEMAFWIGSENGLIVCVGCCHSGLVNTLNYLRRINGNTKIRAVIGGFHLLNASDERLKRTKKALCEMQIEQIVPCHCTSERAFAQADTDLKDRLSPGMAGATYAFQ